MEKGCFGSGVTTSDRAKIGGKDKGKERAMPTFNQLIRHGREEKQRTDRTRASDQCPQKQGVRPRVPCQFSSNRKTDLYTKRFFHTKRKGIPLCSKSPWFDFSYFSGN